MNRHGIIETLRAHEAELKDAGVLSLRLFGSAARGDATPGSDIDLMARFDKTRQMTLIDLVRIENKLSEILGNRVDLSQEDMLKESVRREAEREAVIAF